MRKIIMSVLVAVGLTFGAGAIAAPAANADPGDYCC